MRLSAIGLACVMTCLMVPASTATPIVNIFQFQSDFHLSVEIIDLKENATVFVDDLHETHYNRSALTVKSDSTVFKFITNPQYNKSYSMQVYPSLTNCASQDISKKIPSAVLPDRMMWHWHIVVLNRLYIGPSALLHYIQTFPGLKFQRTANASGILCNKFIQTSNGLTITFYQAIEKSKGYSAGAPVRITLVGTLPSEAGPWKLKSSNVNLQYTFLPIKFGIEKTNMHLFLIPVGIGCPSLATTYKPQSYGGGYFISGQTVVLKNTDDDSNAAHEIVSNFEFTYSHESNYTIMKYPHFKKNADGEYEDIGSVTEIKILAYSYVVTSTQEDCTVKRNTSQKIQIQLGDGQMLTWSSPMEVLNFGSSNYLGMRFKNSIWCDVFERVVIGANGDFSFEGGAPKTILTLYQSASNITVYNAGGSQWNTPVALEIRLFKSKNEVRKLIDIIFHSFFVLGALNLPVFQKNSYYYCSDAVDAGHYVQLKYKAVNASEVAKHQIGLRSAVPDHMADALGVIPIRFSIARIYPIDGGFLATVFIRSRPSALRDFTLVGQSTCMTGAHVVKTKFILGHEEDCAKRCLHYVKGNLCSYYSYCDFNCYIYNGTVGTTPNFIHSKSNGTCLTKKRIDNDPNIMPFTEDIIQTLFLLLPENGKFSFVDNGMNIIYQDSIGNKTTQFNFTGFTDNLPENDQQTSLLGPDFVDYGDSVKLTLNPYPNTRTVPYSDVRGPEQCEDYCANEGQFFCESYSYCWHSHQCIISTITVINSNTSIVDEVDACFIAKRDHLSEYHEEPGLMLQMPGFKTLASRGAEDCAQACDEINNIAFGMNCDSFDFCSSGKSNCVLHAHHIIDVTSSSDIAHSANCSHYSRRYMLDFVREGQKKMNEEAVTESVVNTTSFQCARLCFHSDSCIGFNFCEDTALCMMTNLKLSNKNLQLVDNGVCEFFTKLNPNISATIAVKASKQKSVKKFSSGAVAGVAIGSFAVGGVLAAIGIIVYTRRQGVQY